MTERGGKIPLPLMERGRGGMTVDVERVVTGTPTQPSPIEGEGS